MASRLQGLQGRNRVRGKQQKSYEREQVFPSIACKFAQTKGAILLSKVFNSLKMPFGNGYLALLISARDPVHIQNNCFPSRINFVGGICS